MANEKAKATIYLDGKQAEAALDALRKKAKDLTAALIEAEKAGDTGLSKKIEKELKGVDAATRSLRKETYDYQKVLRDINGSSLSDLKKALRTVEIQFRRMKQTDPGYATKAAQVKTLNSKVRELTALTRTQQSMWQRMGSGLKSLLPIASFAAGLVVVRSFIRKMNEAAKAADNFEERLDNLSALTGLDGSALEELGEIAKKTSVKITEGGVRIKQSADDIVDAYTKVGSQRPELLKNAEALAAVTEDAIILSEAAKGELEPAVAGLTTTMNQFNLGADQSRRIINAMAAGSKEGAADIPYLTEAIEKSGTTLNLMNVSLEENIGLIEAIAPKYAKAQLAGNSLDKVFLKLQEKQIGYTNGIFNVNDALDELAERYKTGETAASIFGVEHAKMGTLLVQNKDEFNRYTKAVTGTNVAIEQAAKNTNNAKAIQAQARNEFHLSAIELGKNLSPAMTKLYQLAGSVASGFSKMIATSPVESLKKEQKEVNALVVELTDANIEEERRRIILSELEKINPKIVEGLDAENLSVVKLKNNMKLYNEELVNRIVLANLTKEEEEYATKVATAKTKLIKEQVDLRELIAKVNPDIAFGNGTLEEKAKKIQDILKETANVRFYGDEAVSEDKINLVGIGNKLKNIAAYQKKLDGSEDQQLNFKKRIEAMKELLGLKQELDGGGSGGGSGGTGGGGKPTDKSIFDAEDEGELGLESWMTSSNWDNVGAEELAKKKASEEEWTAFLKAQIEERTNAEARALQIEDEIAQARIDLKDIQVDAIGQLANSMAGMFEQGSAAQIAMIAIEKAIAIAQIWMNLAREKSAINLAAAQMSTIPFVGTALAAAYKTTMTAKAVSSAAINTGLIAAQAIATGVSAGSRNKKDSYYAGGHTGPGGKYEPAGIVHRKEYVIPEEGTDNPMLRPFIDIMEIARKNGSLARLDLRPIMQISQNNLASGGYASSSSSYSPPTGGDAAGRGGQDSDPELKLLLRKLLTEGVHTNISLYNESGTGLKQKLKEAEMFEEELDNV